MKTETTPKTEKAVNTTAVVTDSKTINTALDVYFNEQVKSENSSYKLFQEFRQTYKKHSKDLATNAFSEVKKDIKEHKKLTDNMKKSANTINGVAFDFAFNGLIVDTDNLYYSTIQDISKTVTMLEKRAKEGAIPFNTYKTTKDSKGKESKQLDKTEELTKDQLIKRFKNQLSKVFEAGMDKKAYSNAVGKFLSTFRHAVGIVEGDFGFIFTDTKEMILKAIKAGKMEQSEILELITALNGYVTGTAVNDMPKMESEAKGA